MAKIISTIKATLTRLIFGAHSLIAIWQVVDNKKDIIYWSLCAPLLLLLFEGIFTIFIKKTQEWRWFCPSVFLYLASIVPAIWLLEFDKVDRRLHDKKTSNHSVPDTIPIIESLVVSKLNLKKLTNITGINRITRHDNDDVDDDDDNTPISDVLGVPKINEDTWITLIEQFLMLILIVGRWMLPKGDLTRDQLSQLLLVYIGTAADIIEFFDSYKDDSIAKIRLLVYLTLGIWSWSLLQFTIVLSATRSRKPRGSGLRRPTESSADCCNDCCCGIDVWGIVLNVILQDAPFLTFRLLIIFQYDIISYMNVFFTCKNSLVILLQLYRLYVVNAEFWKNRREQKIAAAIKARHYRSKRRYDEDVNGIYMISSDRGSEMKRKMKRLKEPVEEEMYQRPKKPRKDKHNKKHKRKDTGYSTASSQNLYHAKIGKEKNSMKRSSSKEAGVGKEKPSSKKLKSERTRSPSTQAETQIYKIKHQNRKVDKVEKPERKKSKKIEAVIEESSSSSQSSNSTLPSYEVINEKKAKSKHNKRAKSSSSTTTDSSDTSQSS